MRTTTIRFPVPFHEALEAVARRQGVSFAAYVREAAMIRWAWEVGIAQSERLTDVDVDLRNALAVRIGLEEIRDILDVITARNDERPPPPDDPEAGA